MQEKVRNYGSSDWFYYAEWLKSLNNEKAILLYHVLSKCHAAIKKQAMQKPEKPENPETLEDIELVTRNYLEKLNFRIRLV